MNYNWTIAQQKELPRKPYTYGTCFSGAGGASMGLEYLSRYKNIFFNEIDKKQITLYKLNLNPQYAFEFPIQELLKEDLTDKPECFDLDILQASPPCSLYSSSNLKAREKKGKQVACIKESAGLCQVIDELYQPAIELCKKLRPKVFIIENVVGLLSKKNKSYVEDIYKRLQEANYQVIHKVVKGEEIGLPQKRNRVFFIAIREDLDFNDFNLDFNEPKVVIDSITYDDKPLRKVTEHTLNMLRYYREGDKHLGQINKREFGKSTGFSTNLPISHQDTFNTITTKSNTNIIVTKKLGRFIFTNPTPQQLAKAQSFPLDYNFNGRSVFYPLGMSVPPLMMAKIVERIEKHILVPFYASKTDNV